MRQNCLPGRERWRFADRHQDRPFFGPDCPMHSDELTLSGALVCQTVTVCEQALRRGSIWYPRPVLQPSLAGSPRVLSAATSRNLIAAFAARTLQRERKAC